MTEDEYRIFKRQIETVIAKKRALVLYGPYACGKMTVINDINKRCDVRSIRNSRVLYDQIDVLSAAKLIIKELSDYDCTLIFTLPNRTLAEKLKKEGVLTVKFMDKRLPQWTSR